MVFLVVGTLHIAVARAGEHEQDMLRSQTLLEGRDETRQLTVDAHIGVLQLHLTF